MSESNVTENAIRNATKDRSDRMSDQTDVAASHASSARSVPADPNAGGNVDAGAGNAGANPKVRVNARNPLKSFPVVAAISVLVLIFLYLPMVMVVVYSFNGGDQALIWRGFSLRWYGVVFTDESIMRATVTSVEIAVMAMVLSTVIGTLFVLAMEQMSRAGSAVANSLINASLVIPEVVLGVSTMAFIRLLGMSPGMVPLVLAHTTFCVPFVVMPIRARMQTLDRSCFEAAVDLGASAWQTVRRVTLPLLTPAIISGALMAFVISMDDFLISNFLTSAGTTTLPIYIFGLIRKGVNPSVNVVATLLLLLAVIVTAVSTLTGGKDRK